MICSYIIAFIYMAIFSHTPFFFRVKIMNHLIKKIGQVSLKTSKEKGGTDSIQTAKLKSFIACLARQWANLLPSPSMRVK